MRFTTLFTALLLALFSAHSLATINLNSFPTTIAPGKNYTLTWTATGNYTYTIWLVAAASGGEYTNEFQWTRAATVAQGLHYNTLTPSYIWTAPANYSTASNFALYIDGLAIPFNGESYSNITAYFHFAAVAATPTTMVTSSSSASKASSSMSETSKSSSSSSMSSMTHSSVASSSFSSATAVSSGESSNDEKDSEHHDGISAGAIAGIVIGILVLIAAIIGGIMFRRWRRKKTAFQQREAAARANRLEPVMSEGSYEMHGRPKTETDI